MSTDAHTEWRVEKGTSQGLNIVQSRSGARIARVLATEWSDRDVEAHAALIVVACNNYDDLVASNDKLTADRDDLLIMLQTCVDWMPSGQPETDQAQRMLNQMRGPYQITPGRKG